MNSNLQRRTWIKQSGLLLAGVAFSSRMQAHDILAENEPIIRLHGNENPYGPSPMARIAMNKAINSSNNYPFDTTMALREKIATQYKLGEANVMIGAGSSEVLGLVAQLAARQKGHAIVANPGFGIWHTAANHAGLDIQRISLTADMKHDLDAMFRRINDQTRLFYICNPNNPTGTVIPADELVDIIGRIPRRVIILLDEAYTEYADLESLAYLLEEYPNLIIAKTFSKIYGLAGARIGFALASAGRIKELIQLQPWANASGSAVSLAGALASLDDHDFLRKSNSLNKQAKSLVEESFRGLNIPYIPSHTNFIYFSARDQREDLVSLLASNRIRVGRPSDTEDKWSRISIGTMDQMKKTLEIFNKAFNT